jgi:hypothetical protein
MRESCRAVLARLLLALFFIFKDLTATTNSRELSHITPSSFQLFKITNQDGNEINSGRN